MLYQKARKLHNGDEVRIRRTRDGKRNVVATVHRATDFKHARLVELSLFMPGGGMDVYMHKEVE
jgi:hypothetical protein